MPGHLALAISLALLVTGFAGCGGDGDGPGGPDGSPSLSDANAAGQRQRAKVLMSTDPELLALQEKNGFADAVVIGNDVILSGVVTTLKDGDVDLEGAYKRTFQAIGQTLARAGATWDDVIEISSFHTDLGSQVAPFVAAKKSFVRMPHPAWTAVGTTGLVGGSGITETRVQAKLATPGR